jgi:hypothetical protein
VDIIGVKICLTSQHARGWNEVHVVFGWVARFLCITLPVKVLLALLLVHTRLAMWAYKAESHFGDKVAGRGNA